MATRDTYTKVHEDWKNKPDKATPVLAEDMEHIEQGIKDAFDNRAMKGIYDDNFISLGRKSGTQRGYYSAALGYNTEASGSSSIAEGSNTIAGATGSHAEGLFTETYYEAQHVGGRYNALAVGAVVIGGGTSDTDRKNIYILDWNGNAIFAGDVKNGANVSLNSLKSDVNNLATIAEGGSIAKVFDTKADLDAWLEIEGNAETLVIGQNIYITATGTPDYWWDGTGLQVLETDKVEIESMTYDETMAILNATAEEVE